MTEIIMLVKFIHRDLQLINSSIIYMVVLFFGRLLVLANPYCEIRALIIISVVGKSYIIII